MTSDQPSESQDLQEILNEIESLQADLRQTSTLADAEAEAAAEATLGSRLDEEPEGFFADVLPEPIYTPTEAPAPVSALSGFELLDAAIRAEQEESRGSVQHDASVQSPHAELHSELRKTAPAASRPETKETIMSTPKQPEGSPEGALTMSLKGNMTLTLNYECAGQSVTVSFGEQFLKVQLADGTEFKIPVGKHSHLKAA
ncbi:MAG: hypothetical protein H7222_01035 [Methylotenera sp.]|nr:hypothetical protein [Oligoflexia bacterium]